MLKTRITIIANLLLVSGSLAFSHGHRIVPSLSSASTKSSHVVIAPAACRTRYGC